MRFEAILATAAMNEEEKAAWCRRQGIFPSELIEWREAATGALQSPGQRSVETGIGSFAPERKASAVQKLLGR